MLYVDVCGKLNNLRANVNYHSRLDAEQRDYSDVENVIYTIYYGDVVQPSEDAERRTRLVRDRNNLLLAITST